MLGKEKTAPKTGIDEVIHAELQIDNDWYEELKSLNPSEVSDLMSIVNGLKSAKMFGDSIDEGKLGREDNEEYFKEIKWRSLGAIKRDIAMLRRELLKEKIEVDKLGEKSDQE